MRRVMFAVVVVAAACGHNEGDGTGDPAAGGRAGSGQGGAGASALGGASGGGALGSGASGTAGDASSGAPGAGGATTAAGGEPGNASAGAGQLVDCDPRKVLCRLATPECDGFEVPSVEGSCYGPCVPVARCACDSAAACPEPESYTCWSSTHCGPFVD